jgi:hypothetical protein
MFCYKKPLNSEIARRNTKKGFKKYMENNPHYFRDVFGDKTIEEAWEEVKLILKEATWQGQQ